MFAALFACRELMIFAQYTNTREEVLAAVRQDGMALKHFFEFRSDKEVVLAAVTEDGYALEHASPAMCRDKEVVLAAVTQDGNALYWADDALQGNKEVVLAAVAQYGHALNCASDELRNDKEVVLVAVTQWGYALKYASAALRNDKEVALKAVARGDYTYPAMAALRLASVKLQADKLLRALSGHTTRAKRLWHLCFVKLRVREIAAWWCKEAAHDEAHFDATGKAQMTGRGAKRSRGEFEAMHKAVRLYGPELLC